METAQPQIQDAVYRLALEVDSLLVNGVTLGCQIPWSTSRGFVGELTQKCLSALDELALTVKQVDAGPLIQASREHIQRIGANIAELVDYKSMPQERVEFLAQDIDHEYTQAREAVKSLEKTLKIAKPFYETRPVDTAKRIEELLRNLPRLFVSGANPKHATVSK